MKSCTSSSERMHLFGKREEETIKTRALLHFFYRLFFSSPLAPAVFLSRSSSSGFSERGGDSLHRRRENRTCTVVTARDDRRMIPGGGGEGTVLYHSRKVRRRIVASRRRVTVSDQPRESGYCSGVIAERRETLKRCKLARDISSFVSAMISEHANIGPGKNTDFKA